MTWVRISDGERDIFVPKAQAGSETQPAYIYWISTPVSPGVQRPKREADHSPFLVPRLRKSGAVLSLHALMACAGMVLF